MSPAQSHVIVEEGLCSRCSIPTQGVHHRHFPEIRAECGSIVEGARHLLDRLRFNRESAQSGWHREELELAIADVIAFLESLNTAAESEHASCPCAPHAPKFEQARSS